MTRIAAADIDIEVGGLDPAVARAILDARAAPVAPPPERRTAAYLLFRIGGETFGLFLTEIGSVLPLPPVTPVPDAPSVLLGLFARGSHVWNLCDPATALGVTSQEGAHVVLLREPRPRIALRIDRASGIAHATGEFANESGRLTRAAVAEDGTRFALVAAGALVEAMGLARQSEGE